MPTPHPVLPQALELRRRVWQACESEEVARGHQLHSSQLISAPVSLKRLLDESPWLHFTSECQRLWPPTAPQSVAVLDR
eukprot:COSAG01_NODE_506_length_16125_cov_5.130912_4_plen_79_part_00